ncbi:MAG: RHS repeat-associated core domain-containing protein [Deltaproteobacteria bacterium]|nr:RHS repeat-associated core domain-containing protein [Deltaproteobacteria bacterium]
MAKIREFVSGRRGTSPTPYALACSHAADLTLDFVLDPAGRRVAVKKNGAFTAGYLYDGSLRVIGKTDEGGRLRQQYVYGTLGHSPDFALLWTGAGNFLGVYLFQHDQLGSVVETWQVRTGDLFLDQKYTSSRVDFGPWGEPQVLPSDASNGPDHPFGFAGGLWDRETGLVRFGAREYDPELGRWLSRDPIGCAGGWNQFGYVAGDPVNAVDPAGLASALDLWPGLAGDVMDPEFVAGVHEAEADIAVLLAESVITTVLWEYSVARLAPRALKGLGWLSRLLKGCGRASEVVKDLSGLTFGRDANQVYHAFRHTDELGLARESAMAAVRDDLLVVSRNIPSGRPLNQVIEVSGQRIQYSAYRLPDGTINVGRIHGVP